MAESPLIIFLDDEQTQLDAIRRMLHTTGLRIELCLTLAEVMSFLQQETVAVLVSDQYMPKLRGLEVLSRVRTESPETVLGLMSGKGDLALATKSINDGLASFYLPKPLRREELVAVLKRSLEQFTGRRTMAEELSLARSESMIDSLTGLFNRRYLESELDKLISAACRHQTPLSLLFIDVNDFKSINDTRGHDVGDRALKAVARWLQSCCRVEDTPGRFAGDEFMILAPSTDPAQAEILAKRIHETPVAVAAEDAGGSELAITLSVGCASWPEDGNAAQEILRAADQKMYVAKANAKRAAAEQTGEAAGEVDGNGGKRPVILFVDDEDQVRATIARQLRAEPLDLLFAGSGKEALDILHDHADVACVVSDLKMPGMNGIELLNSIFQEYPETGRLLLTAHGDFQSASEAINHAHVHGLLSKPWKKADILSKLAEVIGTLQEDAG